MIPPHGLSEREMNLIRRVLATHSSITGAILFGSRAKGTAQPASDIDLALEGIDSHLQAEAIASELDELPLPYRFDVKALSAIRHQPLRDHITRVGVRLDLAEVPADASAPDETDGVDTSISNWNVNERDKAVVRGCWLQTTIGEQATLQRGFDITQAQACPGSIPVISSSGTSFSHNVAMAKGPGVIIGRKGSLGTVFYIEEDYWPHDTTLWVKDFHGNDPSFVYYFFKNLSVMHLDVGSANPTLNRNHVHPIPTLWPPLPEQQRIAALLGAIDDKIDLNRRMNETLEAMARALFKSWFVDFDPVRARAEGRQPDGMNEAIVALFPKAFDDAGVPFGWHKVPLLQEAKLISGGTPKTDVPDYWSGNIAWASAKDVSQCPDTFLVGTERTITSRGLNESSAKMIPRFSTVVVARGATTGRSCLFGREMAMNQTCYGLHSLSSRPFWLNLAFLDLVGSLVHAAHGSVFDTITTKTIEQGRVMSAGNELLDVFEGLVHPLYLRILSNVEEAQTLATLRDLLLPKLLSGEMRIKDAEKAVEAAL